MTQNSYEHEQIKSKSLENFKETTYNYYENKNNTREKETIDYINYKIKQCEQNITQITNIQTELSNYFNTYLENEAKGCKCQIHNNYIYLFCSEITSNLFKKLEKLEKKWIIKLLDEEGKQISSNNAEIVIQIKLNTQQ